MKSLCICSRSYYTTDRRRAYLLIIFLLLVGGCNSSVGSSEQEVIHKSIIIGGDTLSVGDTLRITGQIFHLHGDDYLIDAVVDGGIVRLQPFGFPDGDSYYVHYVLSPELMIDSLQVYIEGIMLEITPTVRLLGFPVAIIQLKKLNE